MLWFFYRFCCCYDSHRHPSLKKTVSYFFILFFWGRIRSIQPPRGDWSNRWLIRASLRQKIRNIIFESPIKTGVQVSPNHQALFRKNGTPSFNCFKKWCFRFKKTKRTEKTEWTERTESFWSNTFPIPVFIRKRLNQTECFSSAPPLFDIFRINWQTLF